MKVACWSSDRFGPAFVAMLAAKNGPPDTAAIARCPHGPKQQWAGKGTIPTFPQWAQHLTETLPIGGRWTVEEVPDHLGSARVVLNYLRAQAQEYGLTQAKETGNV